MRLARPPLVIGPDDGFEQTDIFGYKDFGQRFAHIVEALDSATVIMLDGPWGSGKTTFTQQWAGMLRQRRHAVVRFDAFANDYQDDAFVALAGAIHACSGYDEPEEIEKLKASFLKSAAGITKALPSVATRVVVNLVTQGTLPSTAVSKLVESIESGNRSQLEKRIAKAHENTQAVSEFRACLSELARKLGQGTTSGTEETVPPDKAKRKFVFIVDELDRCKPTFALNLLERIKHLFSVDEVIFVLVSHLPQLARMVEKEYGVECGALYLDKFHHLRVTLPVPDARHERHRLEYLNHLFKKMAVQIDEPRLLELVTDQLWCLTETYNLPLRTLERIAGTVALVCAATNRRYFRLPPLISGLCVMRVVDPQAYGQARTGHFGMNDALKFLRLDEWNGNMSTNSMESAWKYATATEKELNEQEWQRLHSLHGSASLFDVERTDMIKVTCRYIDDFWQPASE